MRTTYESATEAAARLRSLCKAEGWNARDVTIKGEHYSMGSSITATIRSTRVRTSRLKAILDTAERISRCSVTGEILSGSNRYVHIYRTRDVEAALAAPFFAGVVSALERLEGVAPEETNVLFAVEGAPPETYLGWDQQRRLYGVRLWLDGRAGMSFNYSAPTDTTNRARLVESIALHLALFAEEFAERTAQEVAP